MIITDAVYGNADVPSALPIGAPAPPSVPGEMLRRTRRLPAGLSGHLAAGIDEHVVAALLVLARGYCGSTAFRLTLRRGTASARLLSAMPAELALAEHRDAVAGQVGSLSWSDAPPADTGLCYRIGDAGTATAAGLTVSGEHTDTGVVLHADAPAGAYSAESVDRLLGHLENLLAQGIDAPATPIRSARLLSDAERAGWAAFNDTAAPYPDDASIFELFAEHAAAHPDRIAVHHDEGSLTYGALLSTALTVAAVLHGRGVGRGSRVAVHMRRSPAMLGALLGVLRLGAAYVPIDLGVPTARRDFLLGDSGAEVLLTDEATDAAPVPVVAPAGPHTVGGDGTAQEQLVPDLAVTAGDPAYVMYTSGTTGRPKGVVVSQRAVIRLVCGTGYVDLSPDTRMLQTGAIAFDATTFEFWGALLNGGGLVLPAEGTLLGAAELGAAIATHGVNTLFLTAALFNQIVEQDPAALDGCQVLVGGEAVSPSHLAAAMDACPDSEFVNAYGPTENTTFSVAHNLTRTYPDRVPIGRPIANSTAWVLDQDGNPQPVGVPGELYVGGDGLCSGYLNHPELEHVFVDGGHLPATVHNGRTGDRLYRTGDVALLNDRQELEFLGRTDDQVKIRGHRVELAEIEHHLLRAPGVRGAVVLARRDGTGLTSLCAFYTADARLDSMAVAARLRRELPDYLVPAHFRQVEDLPLTANLKIDRAALLRRWPDAEPQATPAGQLSAMEAAVAAIFSEVLALQVRTAEANFFDLGGDSLRMMRLRNRIRTELGRPTSLGRIFDAPTVRGIAAILEETDPVPAAPSPPQQRQRGHEPVLGSSS